MKSKKIMRFLCVMTAGLLLFASMPSQKIIASATEKVNGVLDETQIYESRGGNAATDGTADSNVPEVDGESAGLAADDAAKDDASNVQTSEADKGSAWPAANDAVMDDASDVLTSGADKESTGSASDDAPTDSAALRNPALETNEENHGTDDMDDGSAPEDSNCPHHPEHTEECGYVPAANGIEGSPCGYVCHVCPVEERIAALPGEVTDDNAGEVRTLLDEILSLFTQLTEEEQEQIDLSLCYELQAALDGGNRPAVVNEGAFGPDSAFHWELDADGKLTISGSGDMPKGSYPWSQSKSDIKSLVISYGITSIGDDSFSSCENLSRVTIASSVTKIGTSAFHRCGKLSTISLPSGITSIGKWAFGSCKSLYLTGLPASLVSIGDYAFEYCSAMNVTQLPAGLTTVGTGAFDNCSNLKLTKLPDKLTEIGRYAFNLCVNVKLTELPACLERIESQAFNGCGIKTLTVPASVKYIGAFGLGGCNDLAEITFLGNAPTLEGAMPIPDGALKRLFLPDGWESKGYTAENGWPVKKIVMYVEPYFEWQAGAPHEKKYNGLTLVPSTLSIKLRPVSKDIEVTQELQEELDQVAKVYIDISRARYDNANAGENKTITAANLAFYNGYNGRLIIDPNKKTITTTGSIIKAETKTTFDLSPVADETTYHSITLQITNKVNFSRDREAEYSMDGGETWQSSPTFEGLRYNTEYTFKARVAGSMNYLPSNPIECKATTQKAPLDGTDAAGNSLTTVTVTSTHTYTGLSQELSEGDVQVLWSGEIVDPSQYTVGNLSGNLNAGTASFTVTAKADGDFTGTAEGQFAIEPAEPQVVWNDQTLEYTGKAATPAAPVVTLLNNESANTEIKYVRYIDESLPDGTVATMERNDFPIDVGTYEITAQISVQNQNYAAVEKKITLTIAPAAPVLMWADTAETLTYTGKPAVIAAPQVTLVNGESFAGKIFYSYQNDGGTAWADGLPANAGVYNVKARVEADGNYAAAESSNLLALTIDKAIGVLVIPNAEINRSYSQEAFSLDCSANSDGKITYASSDTSVLTVDENGMATAHWMGKATVTVSLDQSGNYTGAAEHTIIVTITKGSQPENMPENSLFAEYPCEKISDVSLPDGWAWAAADRETALTVGVPVGAMAEYTGADRECFAVTTVEIVITRAACEHPDTELRGEKEATCTAEGYTGDTYCLDCGEKLEMGAVIARVPHRYTSSITKEPTAVEGGVRTYICTICGDTYTESIDKLPERPGSTDSPEGPEQLGGTDSPKPPRQPGSLKQPRQPGSADGLKKPEQPDSNPQYGQPFIKGDAAKNGWDIIRAETARAKEGDTVTVEMNGAAIVPGAVLDDIHGQDISLVFEMEQDVTWRVDGKTITEDKMPDIDFTILRNGNTIPVSLVDTAANGNHTIQFDIIHTGNLGCTALLTLWLGTEYSGHNADLYYYNASSGNLELQGTDSVAADGCATFTFTHASSYVIVIKDTASGVPTPAPGNPVMEDAPDTEADITLPQTDGQPVENAGSSSTDFLWCWIILPLSIAAVFLIVKYRRKHN